MVKKTILIIGSVEINIKNLEKNRFGSFKLKYSEYFGHAQVKFSPHSSIPALGWMDANSLEEEGSGSHGYTTIAVQGNVREQ